MTRNRREFLKESASHWRWSSMHADPAGRAATGAWARQGTPATREAVCPKSAPPAKTLWAVRIQDLDKDSEERLPLSCLQGLVNREQPQIFLAYDRFDEQWLDWLRERGDVKEVRWVGPKELYEKFLPRRERPGGHRSGPARQRQRGDDARRGRRLAARHSAACARSSAALKVAMDLRGRWKKNIEAYRWFYATYGSRMSRRACANYDPGQFELRDYFVEFKIPLVWVSHPKDAERSPAASSAEEAQFARDLFQESSREHPVPGLVGPRAGRRRGLRRERAVFGHGPGQPICQVPGLLGI